MEMLTIVHLLSLVFFIEEYAAVEKELPTYIKKCIMKDRDCVMESSNNAIPFIVKGDPEYNVPNMQPFHVPFISLIDTPQLKLNLSNLEVFGLEEAKMTDFMVDEVHNMHFTLVLSIPKTTIKGEYSVSGQVLVLPIRGVGSFSMILKDGVYEYYHELKLVSIKGENYYQSQGEDLKFSFQNVSIDLGNLFNGDKILGDQVNKLLNENWNILVTEFGPGISTVVTKTVQRIFNGIARKVPAKNVFILE